MLLAANEAARILLGNSNLVGSESEAIIGLFDAAETLLCGSTVSGYILNPEDVLLHGRVSTELDMNSTILLLLVA